MEKIIEIKNLSVSFAVRGGLLLRKIGTVKAVDDVSFSINKGEILQEFTQKNTYNTVTY